MCSRSKATRVRCGLSSALKVAFRSATTHADAGVQGFRRRSGSLLGFVEGAEQWVEAEAALVRRRCTFLLGVSGDQGAVDIEGDVPWLAGSPGR
jgi:hypothetical protein